MPIQAIETQYKNCRFRSRLEARWAVFFDALPIEWQYEPEGFVLDDSSLYLPDFYLPAWDCYAEVKPIQFTEPEYWKANHLPKLCILLDGIPSNRSFYVVGMVETSYRNYISGDSYWRMVFEQSMYKDRIWYLLGGEPINPFSPLTERSITAALSARFEFGEYPT